MRDRGSRRRAEAMRVGRRLNWVSWFRAAAGAAALASIVTLLASCSAERGPGAPSASRPPDIVLVTVEHWWSPDGPSDPFEALSLPGLEPLPEALTVSPQARTAVASALTGLGPLEHRVISDLTTKLPPEVPYLPAELAEAGYTTAGFVNSPIFGWGSGFERGFELYDAPEGHIMGPFRFFPPLQDPQETVQHFLEWADSLPPDRPAFAWIHLTGTNFQNPAAESTKDDAERAKGEANPSRAEARRGPRQADQLEGFRKALASLGQGLGTRERLQSASWLLTATAGRVWPATAASSGYFLEADVLQVPAAAKLPGGIEAPWTGRPFHTPDAGRCLARLAGLPDAPDERGSAGPGVRRAFLWKAQEEFRWPVAAAACDARACSVVEDGATRSLALVEDAPEPSEALAEAAEAAHRAALDLVPPRGTWDQVPEELLKTLAALEVRPDRNVVPPPPPSREVQEEVLPLLFRARRFAVQAAPRSARGAFRRAAEKDPGNRAAHVEAGQILALAGMRRRAKPSLTRALELNPGDHEAWHWLGHVAYSEENYDAAEALWAYADRLQPQDPDVLYDLACARSLHEDDEGADRYLRQAWQYGFRNVAHIQNDPDLRHYRESPAFTRFMQEVVR